MNVGVQILEELSHSFLEEDANRLGRSNRKVPQVVYKKGNGL